MMTKWMKKTLAVLTASALAVGSAELLPDGISEGLTVSASAQEEEFSIYTNGVIARYKGTGGDVVIPSVINGITVTGIESYAFYNCKSITSITVPDTVTSIGSYAFKDCTSLTDITIPRTVTSIESGLFYNCTSLERITIPDTAVSIGDAAFSYCTGLKSISIPDSVTSIGKSAFEFCSSLAEVVIPDSVESIGAYAFTACKSIEQLVIPASVRTIGSCAFAGNSHYKTSLSQITFLGDNFSLPIDAIAQYEDYSKGVKCRTDLTVCAKSGTDAEKAAKRFGYKFIDLDSDKITDYSEIKGCTEITLSLYEAYSDFLTEYYIEKFPEMALEPLLCIEDDHNFFKAVSANIIENSPEKSAPEALYDWMNDNISSPSFSFEEKGYPIDVYRYKTADCCGNANLLCELMRSAGIPAVVATGYVGDMTSEPESDFFVYTMGSSAINHAWVFYYDGGCWKVADSAWNLMLDNKNEIAENYYIIAVDDLAVDSDYYTPLASGGYLSVEKNGRLGYLSKSSTTSWTDGPGCILIDPEEIFIDPYFGGTINGVKQFYDIALGTGKFVTFEGRAGTGLGYVNKNGYLKVYNTLKTDGKTYWFGQNSTAYDITGYDTEMYYGRPVFKVGDKFEVKLVPENNEDLNCNYYTNYNHTEFDNSVGSVNESGIFTVNKPGSGSVYLLLENGEEPAGHFSFYAVDPTLYENIGLRSEMGDGKITLTWDAAESAQKYIVKMLYNDVWVDVMTVNGNSNSAEITGLVNGQSYEFAVDVIPRFISDDSNSWFRYTTKNSVTSIPLQKTIDNIAVNAKPTKTSYFVGEDLDLTGGKATVSYNYGDPVELDLTPAMISGFDSTTAGAKTITVSYEGFTDTFEVVVSNASITGISVTAPSKTSYFVGEDLDLTGGKITVSYNYGDPVELDLTPSMISGFDSTTAGVKTITASYEGFTDTFEVVVSNTSITGISVTAPSKTSYFVGEDLDLTGGKITVSYNYGDPVELDLTPAMISGFDSTTAGVKTITASYEGFTDTFEVVVSNASITGISVTAPTKTTYFVGEDLDLTGGKVTVSYNYGDPVELDLTPAMISGFDSTTAGVKTITASYEGFTDTFEVTVNEPAITIVDFTPPEKTTYFVGENIDLTGGNIEINYEYGAPVVLDLDCAIITGFDSTTPGTKTITVSYEGFTDTFEVTVKEPAITIVDFTPPEKTTYFVGENIDLTGGGMVINYEYGDPVIVDLSSAEISGFDNTKTGVQTVTVRYGDITETFRVTVNPVRTVQSITVVKPKTVEKLYTGNPLVLTGYTLKAVYSDKTTETVDLTADIVTGYDPEKAGTQRLTVTYGGVSAPLSVTVIKLAAAKLTVESQPRTSYYLNDDIDLSSGSFTVTYNSGKTETVPMTDSNVAVKGFDSSKTGTKRVTLTFLGMSVTINMEVAVDPDNAPVLVGNKGYETIADALKANTAGNIEIIVNQNLKETKAVTIPKTVNSAVIRTAGNSILTLTVPTITANCDLTLDCAVAAEKANAKSITIKTAADKNITIDRLDSALEINLSGAKTSSLIVNSNVTVGGISTFGNVKVSENSVLTAEGKITAVTQLDGTLKIANAAKTTTAAITNIGDAKIILTSENGVLAKTTINDVITKLEVEIVDAAGNTITVPSGTSILTAGSAKTDFTGKITIVNKTGSGEDLNAFVYNKDIRAEYAGAITLNGDNYPNFEQAFAHLNATGKNELIINDDLAPAKFTLPTKAEQLTIRSEGDAKTITLNKVTSLAPSFSLTFDNVNIVSEGAKTFAINGKKDITFNDCSITPVPAVKVGANSTLTLSGDVSELGALGGTKSSKLDVKSDVTAASIATFGNVEVGSGYTLTAEGKVSAVTQLDGTLKIANAAKATTTAITNIGDAKIILTSVDGVLAKTTINDVITKLEVEIVDAAGNAITVPSGTAILTSGGKSDFTDKITVSNNDSDMHDLSAFLYKKEIRAEFAGVLSVSGNGIDRNFPNFETAINAINDREKATKANGDYVITINGDTSAAKFTLPKTAGSLTIRSNSDMKTLTLTGTSTLTAKYDLTLENVKIVNLNTKNAESALTISQTAGTLVLDNVVCSTLSTVKGTAKSALDLYSCSIIDTISGFGTANIYESVTVGKTFNVTALNIAAGKGITVPSGKTITAKAVYGAADSFIKLEPGFKPLAFSGTADGTIKLISDSAIAETVQILNSAKASLGVFDVSGITPDDGLDYSLTRTGSKVFCKAAKLGFSGKKFVTFADICTEIENAKNASANYTVEVLADFDSGAALKFPKAGTYSSLTITSDENKKLTFTGSFTLTGNTAFENIDLASVTAKGAAAKYTITGAKNSTLTIDGCDLGLVTAIGAATTDVNISNVKFANGQAVKLTADDLIFANIDGITESVIANTIKADGAQTLKLLEKKTSQIKTGMTNDSGKITINIVTAAGADAALKKGTVIFSVFKGDSFNADLANDGFGLSRDARTFKVTIAA